MAKNVSTNVGEMKISDRKNETTGEITTVGSGEFRTLQMSLPIGMKPIERDANAPPATDDTPTHYIFARVGGGSAEIGVAWEKTIERGDYKGRPMFSMAMNHPDLPEWASNLAAFPRGNSGEYAIVFQRQRQPVAAIPAVTKAQVAGAHAGEDDEIPF